MADIKMTIAQANALRSSDDLLGDFNGLARVPLLKAVIGTDVLYQILTYVQDGTDTKETEINGVKIKMSVKGTAAKVYVANVQVEGTQKRFWIDYFASYAALYPFITSDNFKPYTAEEVALLTQTVTVNGQEMKRRPSTADGATEVSYGYIEVPMSRIGRVVKVGGGTATSTTQPKLTKEILDSKMSKGEIDFATYQKELATLNS